MVKVKLQGYHTRANHYEKEKTAHRQVTYINEKKRKERKSKQQNNSPKKKARYVFISKQKL